MGIRIDSPEVVITFPPIDSIPDGPEDQPTPGPLLEEKIAPFDLPELISGAATWSHFHNDEDKLSTDVPLRTIRLALRYGIRAFDTAPYYDNSEIVLGTALKALETEFPRGSYKLLSKVGRYGPTSADFDYSPDAMRRSVRRSLQRLRTQYLDVVYLHDVEFVAPCVAPRAEGNHMAALGAEAEAYGLGAPGSSAGSGEDAGQVRTAGDDERVLEAISTLRSLQADGLIRHVGISGLPLPALLRTALLVLNRTGRPLDIIQTYSHLTLQNNTLPPFAAALRLRARVSHVLAASPLSMGLLAPPPNAPPAWHPAPHAVRAAAAEAVRAVGPEQVARVAVAWSVLVAGAGAGADDGADAGASAPARKMPVVVGMSNLREVHEAVAAWRWAKDEERREELERKAALALAVFERTGTAGWTWPSGNWV